MLLRGSESGVSRRRPGEVVDLCATYPPGGDSGDLEMLVDLLDLTEGSDFLRLSGASSSEKSGGGVGSCLWDLRGAVKSKFSFGSKCLSLASRASISSLHFDRSICSSPGGRPLLPIDLVLFFFGIETR